MRDSQFLGVAFIRHEKLLELNLSPFSIAKLKFPNHVSTIVELVPLTIETPQKTSNENDYTMILHPIMEEALVIVSAQNNHNGQKMSLLPNQFIVRITVDNEYNSSDLIRTLSSICEVEPLEHVINIEPGGKFHLNIHLHLLYCTNDEYESKLTSDDDTEDSSCSYLQKQVTESLLLKYVSENTLVFVPLPPVSSISKQSQIAVFEVKKIEIRTENHNSMNDIKYQSSFRIRSTQNIETTITSTNLIHDATHLSQESMLTCPGYESLIEEILSLANFPLEEAAPTGVLVAGCKGVGKSRLASVVLQCLLGQYAASSNILSANDIILEASSTYDVSQLQKYIEKFVLTSKSNQRILIIDDLDSVISYDDESMVDYEKRNALNAIISVVDTLHPRKFTDIDSIPVFILGFCCSIDLIPDSLVKIGRFEKTISMFPPTEKQREQILNEMIHCLPIHTPENDENEARIKWSTVIAQYTGGCVASDLKAICVDALTRSMARSKVNSLEVKGVQWDDIKEATRNCIPSQLAQLDVTLSRDIDKVHHTQHLTLKEEFLASFQCFGGYGELKAKIYRTVILPWKRRYTTTELSTTSISSLERMIAPPTGVLFHGPSGTGKTFAAECLASALRLNVIRIRTADILDQWLGGSEAAIRAIFARARTASPCILFFDELDSIAMNREETDGDSSSGLQSRLLSTLLNEMDGISSDNNKSDVLIVATTNRIGAIDAALLRPGRFEEHILLEKPTESDIYDILSLCLEKVPLEEGLDLNKFAELLEELGATGADTKGICSEACIHAINEAEDEIDIDHIVLKASDIDFAIESWSR